MEPMKLLVCDDQEERCSETIAAIIAGMEQANAGSESLVTIIPLPGAELTTVLENFIVPAKDVELRSNVETPFDGYDMVILDNNLSSLDIRGARLTAEAIIGHIRAYSTARYVVSLNKNPEIDFDLRYLIGDFATVADIAVNSRHLEIGGLWTGETGQSGATSFKPWYWPALFTEPGRRQKQINFIDRNLDKPVISALGLSLEVVRSISRHGLGTLSPRISYPFQAPHNRSVSDELVDVTRTTFREFFLERNRSLPDSKERKRLSEQVPETTNQMESESNVARQVISRVVAADIDHWIRRDLIAPQTTLVDLPHLLTRMPFLLGPKASKASEWNGALRSLDPSSYLEPDLNQAYLSAARLEHDEWAPTRVYFWPQLKGNDELNELFFESSGGWADMVFCEDISQFVDRRAENATPIREFEAEFEGAWRRRIVTEVAGQKYVPFSRFAI